MSAPRTRPAPFRPHGTIALLYFVALFFFFALVLVAPTMISVSLDVPQGPEQQAAVQAAVREVFPPRLPWAFALALLASALGTWFQVLPGTRKG